MSRMPSPLSPRSLLRLPSALCVALLHTGLRRWIQRDRQAVDFSVQQQRAGAAKTNGIVIGVGWSDL